MRIRDHHQAVKFSKRAKVLRRRLGKLANSAMGDGSEIKRLEQRVFARLRERERLSRVLAASEPVYF